MHIEQTSISKQRETEAYAALAEVPLLFELAKKLEIGDAHVLYSAIVSAAYKRSWGKIDIEVYKNGKTEKGQENPDFNFENFQALSQFSIPVVLNALVEIARQETSLDKLLPNLPAVENAEVALEEEEPQPVKKKKIRKNAPMLRFSQLWKELEGVGFPDRKFMVVHYLKSIKKGLSNLRNREESGDRITSIRKEVILRDTLGSLSKDLSAEQLTVLERYATESMIKHLGAWDSIDSSNKYLDPFAGLGENARKLFESTDFSAAIKVLKPKNPTELLLLVEIYGFENLRKIARAFVAQSPASSLPLIDMFENWLRTQATQEEDFIKRKLWTAKKDGNKIRFVASSPFGAGELVYKIKSVYSRGIHPETKGKVTSTGQHDPLELVIDSNSSIESYEISITSLDGGKVWKQTISAADIGSYPELGAVSQHPSQDEEKPKVPETFDFQPEVSKMREPMRMGADYFSVGLTLLPSSQERKLQACFVTVDAQGNVSPCVEHYYGKTIPAGTTTAEVKKTIPNDFYQRKLCLKIELVIPGKDGAEPTTQMQIIPHKELLAKAI